MTCYRDAYGAFAKGIHETFCQKKVFIHFKLYRQEKSIIRLILVVSNDCKMYY